ncbi:MAG TPA: PP2C family protein-serine/threonine phosphatase [Thermoanaerobaculia bacterium]|jgi:serine phosphatase RsbU (regulator of sigma subunit)|nr:PP2C family protein-serine/threonine phosphatase [Thermoanaerobaculia bacterium]
MATSPRNRQGLLLLGAVLGLLAFGVGLALAEAYLPEWRQGRPLSEKVYRERYRELAARAGFALAPGEPQVLLVTRGPEHLEPYRALGDAGTRGLLATRSAVRVEVVHGVTGPGFEGPANLGLDFAFGGEPQLLTWWPSGLGFSSFYRMPDPDFSARLAGSLAPVLLAPGETLGPPRTDTIVNILRLLYPLRNGSRPQHLLAFAVGGSISIGRGPGDVTAANAAGSDFLARPMTLFWQAILLFLGLGTLFATLLLRRRISLRNGALLALGGLATLRPAPGLFAGPEWITPAVIAAVVALWIFLLWSCAESLLRSSDAGFTTSLDALLAGRLGPRGGRSLLVGFACGAGLAGLRLGFAALAEALPGVWLGQATVALPLFRPFDSPVAGGVELAGGVALALALALRILPVRWAPAAAALAAGFLLTPLPIRPALAGLAVNAVFAGCLVWIVRRHGITALLVAAVVSRLLPGAALAAWYPEWMPAALAFTAGLAAAIPLLGLLGLRRPAAAETQRLIPPAFVRRLAEERRFRDEMGLLAKMQRGLLPRTLPRLDGWELAARSLIANEAGGDLYDVLADDAGFLWIAAGDVAGHGYSCAIAQAMTKAALASLIGRGRTPAEVLARADRVLRAAGPTRSFTSLALLRLRPESGEGLLSNAGHPFPLLARDGTIEELALPSLPLGQGPARRYEDRPVLLAAGSSLVFFSDGLFEAADPQEHVYGYERLREALRAVADRPAEKIVEALLADWRRHLRSADPLDDTTVLVLKRRGGGA